MQQPVDPHQTGHPALGRKRSRQEMDESSDRRIDSPQPAHHYPPGPSNTQYYGPPPQYLSQYAGSSVPPQVYYPGIGPPRSRGNHQSYVGRPGYPHPAPNRGERSRFAPEDDQLLKWLKEHKHPPDKMSWEQIAEFFPGRKSGTLQVRYCTKLKEKGPVEWTPEMDDKLLATTREYEGERWKIIASRMGPSISAAACTERFKDLEEGERLAQLEGSPGPEATTD